MERIRDTETNYTRQGGRECNRNEITYLYSVTSVPTRFATLVLANATEISNTALAVTRLNRTNMSRNFQKVVTSGTSPTSG